MKKPKLTSENMMRRLPRQGEVDWEEPDLIPFAPEPARPSVRDTKPVQDAEHLAEVAKAMKDHELDRHDAERLIEVERQYTGTGLPRFKNTSLGMLWTEWENRK